MPLRGISFCSFGILYFFLNSFIFLTASYTVNNCRVTQNTQAICQKNSLKVFPKDIPVRVTSLDVSGNNISTLNKTDLENVTNLLRLDLTWNRISKIESGTFVVQISLKVLILNNNSLCKLQEGMFEGLVNLIELYLTYNQIQTVAPASFKSLSKLRILDLGHNKLCRLTNVFLQHTPRLQNLDIRANKISAFHSWELSNKSTELITLDLSQNELMFFRLTTGIFPKLKTLNLEEGIKNGIVWEVNDTSYLRSVVRLDISGVHSSLHELQEVLETFNSSLLRHLQLNRIKNSLQVLINVSCKNPKLSSFEIQNNGLTVITSDLLHLCTNLKILDLGMNEITDISDDSFQSLRLLNTLIMKSNSLTSVPNAVRKTQIKKLDLSCNNINVLRCDYFANMTHLRVLYLYNNPLLALNDCIFKDLVHLVILMLQNSSIDQLNSTFKNNTPNLETLSLLNNKLTVLDYGEFKALKSLQTLSLKGNKLEQLKDGTFFGLSSLKHLDLESNQLSEITNGTFGDLKALKTLNLRSNHIKYASVEPIPHPPFAELSQLDTLYVSSQSRSHKWSNFPQNFLQGLTNLSILYIKGNHLKSVHPHTFNYTPNLNVLFLSNNFLSDIPDNLFSPIQKLKSLYISMTTLRSLDFLLHANLTKLEFLEVGYNTFSVISEPVMLSLPALTDLDMQGNSFTCNCDNAWFLHWVITNKQTQVLDAYNFECSYPPNLKGRKLLQIDVHSCTVDMDFICYISTACAVIMTLAVSFTHHFLQWHLVYAYYLMLAFLYNSKNKDKRDHEYDAFVSYNANDEGWVLGELLPKLEDEQGWRLCLHHRDFQPGKPIMENITDAIYGSRKTICVVSRDYLESEWCSREIQVASFRLFDEQKDVLILVFLEDIPMQQLSPYYRMRRLLKRQTYLSWARAYAHPNLFWEKLRKALETQEHPMGEHIRLTVTAGPPGERPEQ